MKLHGFKAQQHVAPHAKNAISPTLTPPTRAQTTLAFWEDAKHGDRLLSALAYFNTLQTFHSAICKAFEFKKLCIPSNWADGPRAPEANKCGNGVT